MGPRGMPGPVGPAGVGEQGPQGQRGAPGKQGMKPFLALDHVNILMMLHLLFIHNLLYNN